MRQEEEKVPESLMLGRFGPYCKAAKIGECIAMFGREPSPGWPDGRWHLSISHPSRLPTYNELKAARYRHTPDEAVMAQIFPPVAEFVNAHPYCLHLWEV